MEWDGVERVVERGGWARGGVGGMSFRQAR